MQVSTGQGSLDDALRQMMMEDDGGEASINPAGTSAPSASAGVSAGVDASSLPSDPQQLALKFKADIEQSKDPNGQSIFQVQPDGKVKMSPSRGGNYVPPWSWGPTIGPAKGEDGQMTPLGIKLGTPPGKTGDSAWDSMYQGNGGPFTHGGEWDAKKGTYSGGINWGTLLATAAVGGLFAAPAIAAAVGGSAAAGGGAGASSAAGAGTAAGTGAGAAAGAEAGGLASTSIGSGLATLPAGAASGGMAAGAGAAATTGGGAVSSILGAGQKLAPILGNMAKEKAAAQQVNASQDLNAGVANNKAALDQAAYNINAPKARMDNLIRMSLAANAQPAKAETYDSPYAGAPAGTKAIRFSGGIQPGNIGPDVRSAIQDMIAKTIAQQTAGDDLGLQKNLPAPGSAGKSSTGDKILGGASTAAAILGALKGYF